MIKQPHSFEGLEKAQTSSELDISGYRWQEVTNSYKMGETTHDTTSYHFINTGEEAVAQVTIHTNNSPETYGFKNRVFFSLEKAKEAAEYDVRRGYRLANDYGPY